MTDTPYADAIAAESARTTTFTPLASLPVDVGALAAMARPASPIPAALDTANDRLARTDNAIEVLESAIHRLAGKLEPVLTTGSPATYPVDPTTTSEPAPPDGRSTIARSITDLAAHADRLADRLGDLTRYVGAITEHVEA